MPQTKQWTADIGDKLNAWQTVRDSMVALKQKVAAANLTDQQQRVFAKAVMKLHNQAYGVVQLVECLHDLINCAAANKPLPLSSAGKLGTATNLTVLQ